MTQSIFTNTSPKRVNFITDDWGGRGVTHIEIQVGDRVLQLDIDNEKVHLNGFVHITQIACNAWNITKA